MARSKPVVAVLPQGEMDPLHGLEAIVGNADMRVATDLPAFVEALSEADALFVWDFRSDWVREAWHAAEHLRWIHTASAGVDAILIPELVDSEVVLTNSRGVFDRPIAEYVLGVLLAFAKDLHTSVRLQQRREWRHRVTGRLTGSRAVVVGAGGLGRATAGLLSAVGVHVDVVGSRARHDPDLGEILDPSGLDDALSRADAVILAAPLTPDTRGMFDADRFAAMREGATFCNVGRGALVDDGALVTALETGHLGAAALDVFTTEPLPEDSPLWTFDNVIVTPHMSGDFSGWKTVLGNLFADNYQRWRAGEPLRNVVDKHRGYVPKE